MTTIIQAAYFGTLTPPPRSTSTNTNYYVPSYRSKNPVTSPPPSIIEAATIETNNEEGEKKMTVKEGILFFIVLIILILVVTCMSISLIICLQARASRSQSGEDLRPEFAVIKPTNCDAKTIGRMKYGNDTSMMWSELGWNFYPLIGICPVAGILKTDSFSYNYHGCINFANTNLWQELDRQNALAGIALFYFEYILDIVMTYPPNTLMTYPPNTLITYPSNTFITYPYNTFTTHPLNTVFSGSSTNLANAANAFVSSGSYKGSLLAGTIIIWMSSVLILCAANDPYLVAAMSFPTRCITVLLGFSLPFLLSFALFIQAFNLLLSSDILKTSSYTNSLFLSCNVSIRYISTTSYQQFVSLITILAILTFVFPIVLIFVLPKLTTSTSSTSSLSLSLSSPPDALTDPPTG